MHGNSNIKPISILRSFKRVFLSALWFFPLAFLCPYMSLPASNIDFYLGAVSNLRLVKGKFYEDPHYEVSITLLSFPRSKQNNPPSFLLCNSLSSIPFLYDFVSQLRYE